MKGLILKDMLNLKQQLRIYLLVVVIWIFTGFASQDSAFIGGILMIFMAMLPINALAYDEKAKWEAYALSMPVSRRDLVLSKYLLMLIWAAVGAAILILVGYFIERSFATALTNTMIFFLMGLSLSAIMLPVVFRYGTEKGRMALIAVVLIPTLLAVGLSKLNLPMPSETVLSGLILAAPVAVLLLLAGSVAVSCRIYEKKEF